MGKETLARLKARITRRKKDTMTHETKEMSLQTPFYNPELTYEQNFESGPFGAFANEEVFESKGQAQYEIFGQKVHMPFGIAAGPLVNGKFVAAALDMGFDIATYKTVRSAEYACQEWPNVLAIETDTVNGQNRESGIVASHAYKRPLSAVNSFGVPSKDPSFWQDDLRAAVNHARDGQLVIGSFQGTKKGDGNVEEFVRDFATTAKLIQETGVKVMEVNLSCPNEGSSHLVCFDIPRTTEIVRSIRKEIGDTPLIIKIAYFEDKNQLRQLIESVGSMVDGIASVNTVSAKIINTAGQPAFGKGRETAGTMGSAIQWMGLEMTSELKKLREEFDLSYKIIGIGGVTMPGDYQKYRDAGADVVMSATGAMWDPYLAQEIKQAA